VTQSTCAVGRGHPRRPGAGPVDRPLHRLFAHPTDRRWPDPEPTPIPAQTHWPAELPGGRLCLVYTWQLAERPGSMTVLSADGGRTWDLDRQVRLVPIIAGVWGLDVGFAGSNNW
jgi:hypothetical protein